MKRYFISLIGLCALIILLTGCNATRTEYDDYVTLWNQFVVVESSHDSYGTLYITYDKDTKVMYYIGLGSYGSKMSPIYNADGSVKVYNK